MEEVIFFELMQVAVGNRDILSVSPSDEEWLTLYELCKKQSLTGIAYSAVELLPMEQKPPRRLMLKWAGMAMKYGDQNDVVTAQTASVCRAFAKKGFSPIVIKGQSNYRYYPNRLQRLRTPGDIDVWLLSDASKPIKEIIEFCRSRKPGEYVYYHNLDFPVFADTAVEVHYRPTWLFCPWTNARLQKWINEYSKIPATMVGLNIKGGHRVEFPSTDVGFDVLFQLLHIYKHLFEDGIGMRQLLDYYFVLTAFMDSCAEQQVQEFYTRLDKLHLIGFFGSVVYVLQKVFGLAEDKCIVHTDAKGGAHLLSEIMCAGNFGHFDERYKHTFEENRFLWGIQKLKRNMQFVWDYPTEVLCEPLFRVYHFLWRTLRLWKYE